MSKQPPPAPTARAVGPCPTLIQTSRTPRHWTFTQDHRTTRPPPIKPGRCFLRRLYDLTCGMPGRVAQSVGHLTHKSGVLGSIPGLATYFRYRFFKKGSCQLLAKVCEYLCLGCSTVGLSGIISSYSFQSLLI